MSEKISRFKDLRVYKLAFELQQKIFETSKRLPAEERYILTDRVGRASRSIGGNLAEVWQKRRYVAHFVSKLTDADGEQAESLHWLDTATACDYMPEKEQKVLLENAQGLAKCWNHDGQARKILPAEKRVFCPQSSVFGHQI
jgi:four helix bundle protein